MGDARKGSNISYIARCTFFTEDRGVKMQWKAAVSLVLFSLIANQAMAIPIYIDVTGREWLDVNFTRYRSWNDTAAVCDTLSGSCSGILATHSVASSDIDITGYQWATRDEVRDLFYEVAGLPGGELDDYSAAFPLSAGFGSAAFGIFEPTIQINVGPGIENIYNGLTRDTYLGSDALLHGISGIVDSPPFGSDSFTLTGGLAVDTREISMGVFLYKKAVPEPGTLALFGIGLLGVFFSVARTARRAR
jgi:hypothetical protein